jgi:hypothetical protein
LIINDQEFKTIAIMFSVGDRTHISDITFPRLAEWAEKHGYSAVLIKENYEHLDKTPHFNKLVAHKVMPGYDRYIIVDDDLMLKKSAPAIQDIPEGFVGLCKDAVQTLTEASHVKWTANTGFIVADQAGLALLEEAYSAGVYPHNPGDGSNEGIRGPFDQASLNDVLFKRQKIYELDSRWNSQSVINFYSLKKNGWDKWQQNRLHRIFFYLSLLLPFNENRRAIRKIYGLHMTMGVYPRFFSFIHK